MEESILTSTKKLLGVTADYVAFDLDILTHINSAFSTLRQLGVGPAAGFRITDASQTWDTFFGGNMMLEDVKSYVYFRVRLAFDPPATSFAIAAVKEQLQELEWRLNVTVDTIPLPLEYVDPNDVLILDGGTP